MFNYWGDSSIIACSLFLETSPLVKTQGILSRCVWARALPSLRSAGVQPDDVFVDQSAHSGVVMIVVDDQSETHIIVISRANGQAD